MIVTPAHGAQNSIGSSAIPGKRQRFAYLLAAFFVIVIGLLTLPLRRILSETFISAIGDALWSLAVYLLLTLARPNWAAKRIFIAALVFSVCIEFSQIYHAPWIDALRRTLPGRLILGWQFDWQDLTWYLCGCLMGWGLDSLLSKSGKVRALPSG